MANVYENHGSRFYASSPASVTSSLKLRQHCGDDGSQSWALSTDDLIGMRAS